MRRSYGYYESGRLKYKYFFKKVDGQELLHGEDGPAIIEYYDNENSTISREDYRKDGSYYREDGPTIVAYHKNGNISEEKYCTKGNIYHREDGPTVKKYYENGNIKEEIYYINDKIHREDGPALMVYNEDGTLSTIAFAINGQYHRLDGPASIIYNGRYTLRDYYILGNRISEKELTQSVNCKKINEANSELDLLKLKMYLTINNQVYKEELLESIESKLLILKLTN